MPAWDEVECETVAYGAWDSGTRTIYKTPIPLWEETVRSGHPWLGEISPPRWTAYPPTLPARLPEGASEMGTDNGTAGGPCHWVAFTEEAPAFQFAMMESADA